MISSVPLPPDSSSKVTCDAEKIRSPLFIVDVITIRSSGTMCSNRASLVITSPAIGVPGSILYCKSCLPPSRKSHWNSTSSECLPPLIHCRTLLGSLSAANTALAGFVRLRSTTHVACTTLGSTFTSVMILNLPLKSYLLKYELEYCPMLNVCQVFTSVYFDDTRTAPESSIRSANGFMGVRRTHSRRCFSESSSCAHAQWPRPREKSRTRRRRKNS